MSQAVRQKRKCSNDVTRTPTYRCTSSRRTTRCSRGSTSTPPGRSSRRRCARIRPCLRRKRIRRRPRPLPTGRCCCRWRLCETDNCVVIVMRRQEIERTRATFGSQDANGTRSDPASLAAVEPVRIRHDEHVARCAGVHRRRVPVARRRFVAPPVAQRNRAAFSF